MILYNCKIETPCDEEYFEKVDVKLTSDQYGNPGIRYNTFNGYEEVYCAHIECDIEEKDINNLIIMIGLMENSSVKINEVM